MSIQTKVGAGVFTLCALYASSIFAVSLDGTPVIDNTTQGNWGGVYGSCYNVLPQASPRTCVPEVEVGPDFESTHPEQYVNVINPECKRDLEAQPEFSDAVCIKGEAPGNFDVRIYVNNPEVDNAYAWGFNEPGAGGGNEVLPGTSQENACMGEAGHSPDAVYASTFDSDKFAFDPLSGEIRITQGGDARIAYYFLTEKGICRSQKYALYVNNVAVPGAAGEILDFSTGKYVVFNLLDIPDNALVRLDTQKIDGTPACGGLATGTAVNSHLSGIFVDGTQACAEPPPGGDGCTPGFWKNTRKHLPAWVGYTPGQDFSSVFEDAFPGESLKDVLKAKGGGLNALGRHTVAALLNAANSDIASGMTQADVIDAFNAVYPGSKEEYTAQKNIFADMNEQGCPINGKTAPEPE